MGTKGCDLVLLSWNHLECTRPCVESILANTSVLCRLIVVDQASDAETRRYLESLRSTPTVHVELLLNRVNVGYPRGMNQGLHHATAPFVCFLNNDILVPPGWLKEMIAVAESDTSIGTVCPASNTFDIHPPAGGDWVTLARARTAHHGRWSELPYGEGFCLLARTPLMRRVGGFDEATYEQIYFEDADLGRRVQAEGLRCVMAEGTYVWHHGGRTMAAHPGRARLFEENRRRFLLKWGPQGEDLLCVVGNGSEERMRRAVAIARDEANRGGMVWLLVSRSVPERLLCRHLGIRVKRLSPWLLAWQGLRSALSKRRKLARIATDVAALRWALAVLKPLHRARLQALE